MDKFVKSVFQKRSFDRQVSFGDDRSKGTSREI